FEWAERERNKLSDTLASVVSRRGETFRWPEITAQSLEKISWLGCSLNERKLSGVRFKRCALAGTIFSGCTFEDCIFIECDLKGSVFIDNIWRKVTFEACLASSVLIKDGTWEDVRFESTILENSTLIGTKKIGPINFDDCSLQFAQLGR